MNKKVKGLGSIVLMATLCFLPMETKYTHALGDYIIDGIGLKSWTGGNFMGIHLTVIYFGILFILSLFLVKKFAVDGLGLSEGRVFLIFVALIIVFSSGTNIIARTIKKNSNGVFAIAYEWDDSQMNYKNREDESIEFTADFDLTNYSNKKQSFYLYIDSFYYRMDGVEPIRFYTSDGKYAKFEIEGNAPKHFSLNNDDYIVIGGIEHEKGSATGGGSVDEIVLIDDMNNKVRLDRNNHFFGIKITDGLRLGIE